MREKIKLVILAVALLGACTKSGDDSSGTSKDCGNLGKVVYNANGATSGTVPGEQCVGSGSIFYVGGNDGNLAKTGFAFYGWNSKPDGTGINYSGSYQALNNGTLTLYAKWVITYTITYDGNGNTGGTAPTDGNFYVQAANVTALGNTGALTKTGLMFAGWNTNAAGTGTNYSAGATFAMGSANLTLYAKWGTPYTVTYDGNSNTGGSAPTDSNSYIQGQLVVTANNTGTLVRKGHSFAGWNTLANGSGTNYAVGAGLTMGTANVTLFAKWTPNYRGWYCVTSSSDGTKLAAGISSGQIQTSGDSGATWTARDSSRYWYSIASSSDGTKLVAIASAGRIYTSTDSGATWTPRDSVRDWNAVASSSDGTKLVAGVYSGQLYTSTDSGLTWVARDSSRIWKSIASSSDGTKLVAVAYGGQIYTSTDSGLTWTARDSSRNWYSVTSSSDGTKLVAVVYGGQVYTSIDSGLTWTARDSSRNWYSVSSSSDGTKLVAGTDLGQIYTSTDSGVTWVARDSSRKWISVASSSDGTKLAAVVIGGWLYTSTDSGVTWEMQY
ncbi:MAG: InlB B-repeat-containing protein [Flavobacteriales bacterium]|nr:InlB B-repeat-containing protein [Flavobacteriales bacterium]